MKGEIKQNGRTGVGHRQPAAMFLGPILKEPDSIRALDDQTPYHDPEQDPGREESKRNHRYLVRERWNKDVNPTNNRAAFLSTSKFTHCLAKLAETRRSETR